QRFPSGPGLIPPGPLAVVGMGPNSVMVPSDVIRPTLFPFCSVNHRLPSIPAAIDPGWLPAVGTANSVSVPAVVILPILFPSNSVNQRFPSGPEPTPCGLPFTVGSAYSANITPAELILPILFARASVNHRFPSGPAVIQNAPLLGVVMPNSVTVPAGVIRPIAPPACDS